MLLTTPSAAVESVGGAIAESDAETVAEPEEEIAAEPEAAETAEAAVDELTAVITGAAYDENKNPMADGDEEKTVSLYTRQGEQKYAAGWLVCTQGADYGSSFPIYAGFNRIGRGGENDVTLTDPAVSEREHCSVIYEDRKNVFYIFPKDSGLVYANGAPVERAQEIGNGQVISLDETRLELVVFCRGERRWKMTLEEYEAEAYRHDALVSYLGMGDVSLIDANRQPFRMEKGDIVLLCSDGLYRSLADEEILFAVRENGTDMQMAADALMEAARRKNNPKQDNTSVVTLRYNGPLDSESRRNADEFKEM